MAATTEATIRLIIARCLSGFHLGDDHVRQFQAVANFRVHHRRILDFLPVQPNCGNDSGCDQLGIFGSCRLPGTFEALRRRCRRSVEQVIWPVEPGCPAARAGHQEPTSRSRFRILHVGLRVLCSCGHNTATLVALNNPRPRARHTRL